VDLLARSVGRTLSVVFPLGTTRGNCGGHGVALGLLGVAGDLAGCDSYPADGVGVYGEFHLRISRNVTPPFVGDEADGLV
jgi:hypothetical protein